MSNASMKWKGAENLPAVVARYESAHEATLARYEEVVSFNIFCAHVTVAGWRKLLATYPTVSWPKAPQA